MTWRGHWPRGHPLRRRHSCRRSSARVPSPQAEAYATSDGSLRIPRLQEFGDSYRRGSATVPSPVAVGTTVARRPPHRPVLALLTHTVPALDCVWLRSALLDTDVGFRPQAASAKPLHESLPRPAGPLTSSPYRPQPDSPHLVQKRLQSLLVARHCMVLEIPLTTDCRHFRVSRGARGSVCRRFAAISFSLAALRLPIVFRRTVK
jgi:hypothetical protein